MLSNKRMNLPIGKNPGGGPAPRAIFIHLPLAGYAQRSADMKLDSGTGLAYPRRE